MLRLKIGAVFTVCFLQAKEQGEEAEEAEQCEKVGMCP
jgi:hypothetical protein